MSSILVTKYFLVFGTSYTGYITLGAVDDGGGGGSGLLGLVEPASTPGGYLVVPKRGLAP